MEEHIDLVTPDKPRAGGVSLAVGFSMVFHVVLMILFLRSYRPAAQSEKAVPIQRYVEFLKQNPQDFVEAPGTKRDTAPINAPYSDANRRASMPKPTGDKPTNRPGDGSDIYIPQMGKGASPQQPNQSKNPSAAQAQQPVAEQSASPVNAEPSPEVDSSRIPALRTEASAAATGAVNWRSVVSDVKQIASLGSGENIDVTASGGERGSAETGAVSFETQWFDWGDYAKSMVSKIRVHWYENMPMLIRTGMKGVVTIRFTIHRDGQITDVTLINTSEIPPYDFAARKAIELASPLNPLPANFPKTSERVTAMFYYNREVPSR